MLPVAAAAAAQLIIWAITAFAMFSLVKKLYLCLWVGFATPTSLRISCGGLIVRWV